MLGPARDMDLGLLDATPCRARRAGGGCDGASPNSGNSAPSAKGRRAGRRFSRAAIQPACCFGKAHGRAARHAQRRGQHDPPPGRIDAQRGAAGAGAAQEGDGQGIAGMSNGQLLGLAAPL